MRILLVFYFSIFSINLFANNYIDSITLTKIKKLVQKEEEIAFAYKKYILEKGKIPSTIKDLKDSNYLSQGFETINPFGKQISFKIDDNSTSTNKKDDKHEIDGFKSTDPMLKSNLYDYYYSNKYRTNTKAPLSINNSDVEIILSSKEKFIYENSSNDSTLNKITTTAPNSASKTPKNSYYLDKNGVLHWYDSSGNYKYSFDKELVLDESVTLFKDGTVSNDYKDLVKDIEFAGMTILYKKNNVAEEYVNIGFNSVIKVNQQAKDIGKTIIQFSRRAGGMIVNGDIYTWGNNGNKITGINLGYSGNKLTNAYPVITGLVPIRAKMYDDDSTDGKDFTKYYEQNYFSSPNRPKFVDFFSTVFHSTCGISTKGELYCGGIESAINKGDGYLFTQVDESRQKGEMLYRSIFFDGKTNKAKKVFANNQVWHILGTDNSIYAWGNDGQAFSGNGSLSFNSEICETICTIWSLGSCTSSYEQCSNEPRNVSTIKFSDITYLLTSGHRKIGGLSTTGDIYIWGSEYYKDNSSTSFETYDCSNNWQSTNFNLCTPTKVETSNSTMTTTLKFESIQGGLDAFVAKSENGKYYKISHPKTKKIQVTSIDDAIKSYSEYVAENDAEILSVDFSRKIDEQEPSKRYIPSSGIVWVNSKNELKGDYLSSSLNPEDTTIFKNSIKQIKWKKIKVIDDDNGMCGIDVNNQMYCWGIQSFYRNDRNGGTNSDFMGNTFMIPVFNTNLYDLDKDFLIAEGGSNGHLTNMTSGDWATTNSDGKTGAFFMKYPTYIGGFNYEFIFK